MDPQLLSAIRDLTAALQRFTAASAGHPASAPGRRDAQQLQQAFDHSLQTLTRTVTAAAPAFGRFTALFTPAVTAVGSLLGVLRLALPKRQSKALGRIGQGFQSVRRGGYYRGVGQLLKGGRQLFARGRGQGGRAVHSGKGPAPAAPTPTSTAAVRAAGPIPVIQQVSQALAARVGPAPPLPLPVTGRVPTQGAGPVPMLPPPAGGAGPIPMLPVQGLSKAAAFAQGGSGVARAVGVALPAAGAAGGSAAGGGVTAAAGALASNPAGWAVGAVAAVAAVTVAFAQLPFKINDFAKGLVEANRELAGFSPSMAMVMQQVNFRETMRNMRKGEQTAGSAGFLANNQQDLSDKLSRIEAALMTVKNVGGGLLARAADVAVPLFEIATGLATLEAVAKKVEGWLAKQNEGENGRPLPAGEWLELLEQDADEMVKNAKDRLAEVKDRGRNGVAADRKLGVRRDRGGGP